MTCCAMDILYDPELQDVLSPCGLKMAIDQLTFSKPDCLMRFSPPVLILDGFRIKIFLP